MTFQDRSQSDPSQPLTLDRPQTDPNPQPPYPRPPQLQPAYQRAQPPPSIYIPDTNRRGPDQWGGEHWPITAAMNNPAMPGGPDMPSGLEAYPTAAKSGGYLARWGSDNINQQAGRVSNLAMGFAPILDMLSRGAFSRGFNASSLNSIKIQQQRLILEMEEMQQRHAQELTDYGTIFAKADSVTKNPKATEEQKIRAIEDAREELRFLAETRYGHHPLTAVIDSSGGLDAAKNFLSEEDAYFREAWGAQTSLKKVAGTDRDADTATEFGVPAPGPGMGRGIFGGFPDAPVQTAEDLTTSGPRAPQTAASSDYDRDLLRRSGASAQELDMARQISMGQVPRSYSEREKIPANQRTPLENKVLSDVNKLQNQITRDVENAANIPNDANDPRIAQQKLDQLRRANPALAAEISGLGTYNLDPKGEDRLGDRRYINSLVSRFFPGYQTDNYQIKKDMESETSKVGTSIKAAKSSLGAIALFMDSLKEVPQRDSVPVALIRRAFANDIANTGQYRNIALAAQQLALQLSTVTTNGVPRVTIFNQRMDNLGSYVSPEALRGLLKQETADVWSATIGQYQPDWENRFKRKDLIPTITKDTWKDFSSILRSDAKTGKMPSDSSNVMLSVGRNVKEGHPMTASQARDVDNEVTAIRNDPEFHDPNSPNYAKLHHDFDFFLSKIPPIRYPPWMKPELD